MTTDEAAAALGIKRRQVINLINVGQLEGRRLGPYRGGTWAVSRASVEALKAAREAVGKVVGSERHEPTKGDES